MDEYKLLIEDCAQQNINKDIPNSSTKHAYIGIKALLKYSKKDVRITSGEFYYEFWIQLTSDIRTFLCKKDTCLSVIIQRKSLGLRLLKTLKHDFPKNVNIYLLNQDKIKKQLNMNIYDVPDFLVSDSGYRFEESDSEIKKKRVCANINFGDAIGKKQLISVFEKLKTTLSDPI